MVKPLNPLVTDQFFEIFDHREYPKDQFYCYMQYRPDGTPFYVGKGSKDRCLIRDRNRACVGIIKKYEHKNIKIDVFYCSSEVEAFQWEKELIFMLRCNGVKLANFTDGGEGASGQICSKETRAKLSKNWKGRKHTPESRAKMSASHKGASPSERARQNISKAGKGRKFSEEHKKNISKGNKGVSRNKGVAFSIEHRANIGLAHRGKSKSLEQRKKISEALTGRPTGRPSAMKGKKRTAESNKKTSQSLRKFYDNRRAEQQNQVF